MQKVVKHTYKSDVLMCKINKEQKFYHAVFLVRFLLHSEFDRLKELEKSFIRILSSFSGKGEERRLSVTNILFKEALTNLFNISKICT